MRTVFGSTAAPQLRVLFTFVLAFGLALALQIGTADAKKRKGYNSKYAAIVIDARTGRTLHASRADARRYPASLTKMMTVYLMFEDLKSGRIKLSDRVVMTRAGARREPSKLGIRVGRSISVEQAILSLVTKSANDVATAVGDKLSGSEAAFARRMTRKARQLGMKSTTFKNANGLTAKGQTTTARDMARLGLALREHFPRRYSYFKTREFRYGKRRYGNHNKLLGRVRGVDGIKTGYTRASGFNLVSSVNHNGRRIVAVVMGGRTGARRNRAMKNLIARYLPKASRRGGGTVMAAAQPSASSTRLASLAPTKIATPSFAPRKDRRLALAHSTSPKAASATALALKAKLAERQEYASDRTLTASAREAAKGTWHIQLAAGDDRDALEDMLSRVKRKNASVLANASAHMPTVNSGGQKLWRARFVGFPSKASARRACQVLRRQRMDCLALQG